MDNEELKAVIVDQRMFLEERLRTQNIVDREILGSIRLGGPTALIILGIRRCGKSILSTQLFRGYKFGYISFDDERMLAAKTGDLNNILQVFYELYGSDLSNMVFDEIQEITGWEPFVSRLRDTKKVIVTGSNSKLLGGELSSRLTGRHLDTFLYPFSFCEFLSYQKFIITSAPTTQERAELSKLLSDYMSWGGFPERFMLGKQIVRNIYDDIINKDVCTRHRIKHVRELRQVALFLVSNFGREFTNTSLIAVSGIKSRLTVSKWAGYLEEAYLIFSIERFSYKLKHSALAPRKVYCIDNGIINEVGMDMSENRGRLMENIVAVELKRRTSVSGDGLCYWKDHRGREVDFVVKEGKRIGKLLQVTYASSYETIAPRELDSLTSASAELKCNVLFVITWDYEGSRSVNSKRITFIPLWKWLMEKKSSGIEKRSKSNTKHIQKS